MHTYTHTHTATHNKTPVHTHPYMYTHKYTHAQTIAGNPSRGHIRTCMHTPHTYLPTATHACDRHAQLHALISAVLQHHDAHPYIQAGIMGRVHICIEAYVMLCMGTHSYIAAHIPTPMRNNTRMHTFAREHTHVRTQQHTHVYRTHWHTHSRLRKPP